MPKISVIVPVYNVEKYLDRCVESIVNQTYTDFELILVDDGSPDNCGAMCDEWAKKDSRIRVIHKENGGLSSARNAGLDIMLGEYVTFIDSDDVVHFNYLKTLFNILTSTNADVATCKYLTFREEPIAFPEFEHQTTTITGREYCHLLYSEKKRGNYIVSCAKLWKASCYRDIRFPLGKIHEDSFITFRVIYEQKSIVMTSNALYAFFENPSGITGSPFSIRRYDDIEAFEEAEQFFVSKGELELIKVIKNLKLTAIAMFSLIARKKHIYKTIPQKYKMSFIKSDATLKQHLPYNEYEYFMFDKYPMWIKLQAKVKKLFDMFKN